MKKIFALGLLTASVATMSACKKEEYKVQFNDGTGVSYSYTHGGYITEAKVTVKDGAVTTVDINEFMLFDNISNLPTAAFVDTPTTGITAGTVERQLIKWNDAYWGRSGTATAKDDFFEVKLLTKEITPVGDATKKFTVTYGIAKTVDHYGNFKSLKNEIIKNEVNMKAWIEGSKSIVTEDIVIPTDFPASAAAIDAATCAPATVLLEKCTVTVTDRLTTAATWANTTQGKKGSTYMPKTTNNTGSWTEQIGRIETFMKTQLNAGNMFDASKFTAATGKVADGDRKNVKFGNLDSGSTMSDTNQYCQAALTAASRLLK